MKEKQMDIYSIGTVENFKFPEINKMTKEEVNNA